jgi:hypothetical protein
LVRADAQGVPQVSPPVEAQTIQKGSWFLIRRFVTALVEYAANQKAWPAPEKRLSQALAYLQAQVCGILASTIVLTTLLRRQGLDSDFTPNSFGYMLKAREREVQTRLRAYLHSQNVRILTIRANEAALRLQRVRLTHRSIVFPFLISSNAYRFAVATRVHCGLVTRQALRARSATAPSPSVGSPDHPVRTRCDQR